MKQWYAQAYVMQLINYDEPCALLVDFLYKGDVHKGGLDVVYTPC